MQDLRTWSVYCRTHLRGSLAPLLFLAIIFVVFPRALTAAEPTVVEPAAARQLLQAGKFQQVIAAANTGIESGKLGEEWRLLKLETLLATGRNAEALTLWKSTSKRYSWSVQVCLLGQRVLKLNGQSAEAALQLERGKSLLTRYPWRYTDTPNLLAGGRLMTLAGDDARQVLETFYDRAKKEATDSGEPYLATGELALAKHDDGMAAAEFAEAVRRLPENADAHYGLAVALSSSNAKTATASLQKALELNPNHVPSLLMQANQLVDAEQYTDAQTTIDRIITINPRQADAWAYRAVLAHLEGDPKGEQLFRAAAHGRYLTNPAVDHLIGKKLSQKYRFAEGAVYQRSALEKQEGFAAAVAQLSQDLLRLGQEEEGWRLAQEAFDRDGYDVVTFNLATLHENISRYSTLENEDFVVRMEAREAAVYGDRVLLLLGRAKEALCRKYGLELKDQIIVEIFADQADFAVRTFGMPGGAGFLGVCFGKVITANSPASQVENPSNWEAVLWHEFCHTVTLTLTHNKMPRWLSEGISVYEEKQADARWGQSMNPHYRQMILGGKLTPISKLSGAFLSPPSPMHLQFAYYESSLVVEYIIEQFGLDAVKHILRDLGAGVPINTAIERHTVDLAKLEANFEKFAQQRAAELAPKADWDSDAIAQIISGKTPPGELLKQHPNSLPLLSARALQLLKEEKWQEAKAPLQRMIELYPGNIEAGNPYAMLALAHRKLDESDAEIAVLEKLASSSADSVEAYQRLMELQTDKEDWAGVARNAKRQLAVNPLIAQPHLLLAGAAEKLKIPDEAIRCYRTLLALDHDDLALVHYKLAHLLQSKDGQTAKYHVLRALEEAPRFREAHRLLLKIHRRETIGRADAAVK